MNLGGIPLVSQALDNVIVYETNKTVFYDQGTDGIDSIVVVYDAAGKNIAEENIYRYTAATKKFGAEIYVPMFFSQNNMTLEDGDNNSYTYNNQGYPLVVSDGKSSVTSEYTCK